MAHLVRGAEFAEVGGLRRAPEFFEVGGVVGDAKVIEDATALVIDHDDGEVAAVAVGGEQRITVVQEREVAAEQ